MISVREFLFLKYGLTEAKKRDYKEEYKKYHSSKKAIKHRAARVKARRELEKEGRVHKGDGMDIDHKKALSKGGSNGKRNLRVVSKHKNRGKDNN
jgi:hypothetical protein